MHAETLPEHDADEVSRIRIVQTPRLVGDIGDATYVTDASMVGARATMDRDGMYAAMMTAEACERDVRAYKPHAPLDKAAAAIMEHMATTYARTAAKLRADLGEAALREARIHAEFLVREAESARRVVRGRKS